jgi:penicillin-binding protein 1C
MRYRLALANSLNIAAVKVLASIGGPAVLQRRLQECGLTTLTATPEHYGLGLTIGNAEARLLELANAYACLARLGEYQPYTLVQGQSPASHRVFDAADCFLLADILSDNSARALAFGAESNLRFDFPVACKTGTSSDFRDNWAFGYTPEFTVGVWAGNADGSPMQGISGVTGAAPILHELLEHLHQRYGTTWYATPTNVVQLAVHAVTGKRLVPSLRPNSPDSVVEAFVAGRLPPEAAASDYDSRGHIRLGAEYRDWLQTSDNWLAGKAVVEDAPSALRIVFPLPGTTFYLDPDLPDGGRRVHLRADGSSNPGWHSDTLECRTEAGQTIAFLEPGKHRLSVQDPLTGARCETWVQVLER